MLIESRPQDPTTVVLGDLTELQESYVARSAVPSDADHVQIEMVRDDIRIWQILGETVYQPAPISDDGLEEPLTPQISVLHARCGRIETGIEVIWGVSITRGARNYEVDISYDRGVTWDVLSPFGPASTGRAQMRQVDGPVSVRARAYGRTGLHGNYITTTFTTVAPVVDGAQTGIINLPPIDYAGLADEVKGRFVDLDARATDLLTRVQTAAATGNANTAAIIAESQTRLNADSALATDISAIYTRLGGAEAAVVTERTARIDGDGIQASRTDLVIVQQNSDRAFTVSENNARINADGALSTRIDAVLATTGSNTAAISAESRARTDGDSALANQTTDLYARSDAGTAVGRFSMQAVSGPSGVSARIQALLATQRGGQTYGAGYYLDLMSDGTSRFVIDANAFYITSNGSSLPLLSPCSDEIALLRIESRLLVPPLLSETELNTSS